MILLAFVKYCSSFSQKILMFFQIIWTLVDPKKLSNNRELEPIVITARDDLLKQSLTIGFWFRLGLIFFLALPTFF